VCQDGLQRIQDAGPHAAQFACEIYHQEFWRSLNIARYNLAMGKKR